MRWTSYAQCSRLYRATVRSALKNAAFKNELAITMDDEFGLLFGTIFFTVTGTKEAINEFRYDLGDFVERWQGKKGD